MAIPRSTLITGAIALVSTSAVVYLLMRPPPSSPDEEEPAYTPAKPGSLNPIAAKVLAEGGPRTPTAASAGGLQHATGTLSLHFENSETVASCVATVFEETQKQMGQAATESKPCVGEGSQFIEGNLVLSLMPVGTFGAPTLPSAQATCTATFRGTLSRGQTKTPVSTKIEATGEASDPCGPLKISFSEAFLRAISQ